MTLKEIRLSKSMTQKQAAACLGVSLRSYVTYEADPAKADTLKYRYLTEQLALYVPLDEEHGILGMDDIRAGCRRVLDEYPVRYCILFGSYAKGIPTEKSDLDMLISADVTGLRFYGLAERLRGELKKKVDLLDVRQLYGNPELLDEILKDGIRIYE